MVVLLRLVDHRRRRVAWASEGRSAETLHVFDRSRSAGRARIALVTVDLAAGHQKALRARVPHTRAVFDRFHVQRLAADAVDAVRRAEQQDADPTAATALKGMRYPLLKHPARPRTGEARRLVTPRRQNRALDRACELKEHLATILEQSTPTDAPELLDEWLGWAARSRLTTLVKVGRTLRQHATGILADRDTRLTNGPVDGINNEPSVVARRTYGSHSHGALAAMLLLCCGGIDLAPPLLTRI